MSYNFEPHSFYCIGCGNKTFDLQRKVNHKHGKHHLKKLWCPTCKMTVNCVECRNDEEIIQFKEKWKAGEYQEDFEASVKEFERENKIWS